MLGSPGAPSVTVTWGALALTQPEIVVAMPCGYNAARAHAEAMTYSGELAGLCAEQVVAVNASAYFSRPGPRLIDGLELLAHILHPEEVPDAPAVALTVELRPAGLLG